MTVSVLCLSPDWYLFEFQRVRQMKGKVIDVRLIDYSIDLRVMLKVTWRTSQLQCSVSVYIVINNKMFYSCRYGCVI